mgnify:CR=1 FL=1
MKKGILFDLDGTLWHSAHVVTASWNRALRTLPDFKLQISGEDMMRFMGNLLHDIGRMMLPRNLSDTRVDEMIERCIVYEHETLRAHGAPLFPGTEDALRRLQDEYALYIVSNCQAGYIEIFLEYYGFDRYFADFLCPGMTGCSKAENIRRIVARHGLTNAVYVGDTNGDALAAASAGISFIHAAYGYGRPERAGLAVKGLSELPALLSALGDAVFLV